MALVGGVAVSVVDEVGVAAVGDGDVPTAGAVHVVVPRVLDVIGSGAFIDVAFVDDVKVPVVHVIDVFTVGDGDVTAAVPVDVVVVAMLDVGHGHWCSSCE